MEPFEEQELSDRELDALLPRWNAPTAPVRLRATLFPEDSGRAHLSWRDLTAGKLWTASIRIPVPLAVCLAIVLAAACWQWTARVADRAVIHEKQAEVQPVAELQPKIIRRGHAPN